MPESPRPASGTKLSPRLVEMLLAVEKHVLPLAYVFLALVSVDPLLEHFETWRSVGGAAFAPVARDALLILLTLFTGVALFLSRPPVVVPDRLDQVLIPIAMSYYFLLYGFVNRLPEPLGTNLLPPAMQAPAAVAGLVVSIAGYAVAIWALCHLGRSFAVLVAVRKVVMTGPYARVRHPIYLGYVIDHCGLLLTSGSIAMLVLTAGFLTLLRLRARLEEQKLAEADEGYRAYVARTGFLFPRF